MMNLLLKTGNSTVLTGCPSALCVCVAVAWWAGPVWGSSGSVYRYFDWDCKPNYSKIPHFLKANFRKYRGLTLFVNKLLKNVSKLNGNFRNPSAEKVLAFKQLKAKARHIIKIQNKTSWQSFCSSLTSKTKPKTVWKAIRKAKGKNLPPL